MSAPSLSDHLRGRIESEGPLTVAQYMAEALSNPDFGYYMNRDPFGIEGDFITAPEISQMFGEIIGLWCAVLWQGLGAPAPFNLVELGPGRGTLMADLLKAAAVQPGFLDAARVHLVETSPVLTAAQEKTLSGVPLKTPPQWHRRLEDVPEGPMLLIANEFFDALPIRQFVRGRDGWSERLVGVDAGADPEQGSLVLQFEMSPPLAGAPEVPDDFQDAAVGSVFEVCPDAQAMVQAIAARIARSGGAALIVDYGHPSSAIGETLQAVKGHSFHDILADPGEADLTAHVDFGALAEAANRGADGGAVQVLGPVPQGAFLERLGLSARAAILLEGASPEQAEDIRSAQFRLTDVSAMGSLFKVLALAQPGLAVPPWS
ncbi:MAG: SAM-dependent methyltransferase [Rhodospirillales bacterium]|nr:SAM-dependent methyltransferase [Rhodospirillales bacterium]